MVTRTLPDGSRLTLVADTTAITEVRSLLRGVMVAAALGALAVAGLALVAGVAAALRPLDRMTAVARRITGGDRGARLAPDRPGTELGRAAAAFDDALDALEDAEARARRAADELRGFLADAAHELRTPLAGVQALAEAMLVAPADAERGERRARLLVRETGRASRLVSDLLDLARAEGGLPLHRTDVDLAMLAAVEVERVRELAPRLTVTLAPPHPPSSWPTPGAPRRSWSTCSTTPAATPRTAARSRSASSRATPAPWWSPTPARESPTTSATASSAASSGCSRRATATPAAPGSAFRSPGRWPARTAASSSRSRRRRAPASA